MRPSGAGLTSSLTLGIVVALAHSLEPANAHNPVTTKVTWAREISAILSRRCVSCHTGGGYARFSLETYEDARPWAVAMKEEVLAGSMPPWGAAPGVGHFANDRRLTRHEQELIAAWVDGGAPYSPDARTPAFATSPAAVSSASGSAPRTNGASPPAGGVAVPLAPATIEAAEERVASVTLQLPGGLLLTGWTFEPGVPASVERVDLELASRWLGTWTPGESAIEWPPDVGVPLTSSALFTARITYRAPAAPAIDYSRVRIWMTREQRPKSIREATVVRSWRTLGAVDVVALRPTRSDGEVQVLARYPDGRAEALGLLAPPSRGAHPTYRLVRPLALPAGARVDTTAPIRLLYSVGATRIVKSNVSRRPRR